MSEVLKVNNTYTTFDGYQVIIKSKYANLFLAEVEIDDDTYQVTYDGNGTCITFPTNIGFSGPEFDIVIEPEDISTDSCQDECCESDCCESCDEESPYDACDEGSCCKDHDNKLINLVCYSVIENLTERLNEISVDVKRNPSNEVHWNAYNSILSNLYMWVTKLEQFGR